MYRRGVKTSGFTLIELILVLVIIAIITAIVMPSVSAFSAGRSSSNMATQLIALTDYARTEAAAEGRTFRLNFDASKGTYWLTAQRDGVFVPPDNQEYGQIFLLPEHVQWDITFTSKMTSQMIPPIDEQQVTTQMNTSLSQPTGQQNYMVQNSHENGSYVEFDPSGRVDPAQIKLTDVRQGNSIVVGCLSATELFHILTPQEMTK
jgi:type II secretion system protein H